MTASTPAAFSGRNALGMRSISLAIVSSSGMISVSGRMVVPRLSHGLTGAASVGGKTTPPPLMGGCPQAAGMLRPYARRRSSVQALKDPGRSHPPSDAHGDHAALQ